MIPNEARIKRLAFLKTKIATWEFCQGRAPGETELHHTKECGCLCSQSLPHRKPNCSPGPCDSRLGEAPRLLRTEAQTAAAFPPTPAAAAFCKNDFRSYCLWSQNQGRLFAQFGIADIKSAARFAVERCLWTFRPCLLQPSKQWEAFPFFSTAASSPVVGLP